MIEKIMLFYLFVFIILIFLRMMKPNIITFVALSWFGPIPEEGELLSNFKIRKIRYAFSWVLQFIAFFVVLFFLNKYFEHLLSETAFMVASFAGAIGIGMAIFATVGFTISWLKTTIVGPNPACEYIDEEPPHNH